MSNKRQRTNKSTESVEYTVVFIEINEDSTMSEYKVVFQDEEMFRVVADIYDRLRTDGKPIFFMLELLNPKTHDQLMTWTPETTKEEFEKREFDDLAYEDMLKFVEIVGFERLQKEFLQKWILDYEQIKKANQCDGLIDAYRTVHTWI
jgi:hypothetical protein